ncbi:MAG: lysoplasmalogenase [Clostridia bacterium]|nr:lysoplasmalogenase [Clostridia bacterium]
MKWYWAGGCLALMTMLYLIYQSIKWGSVEHKWQEWFFKGAATAMAAVLAFYGYSFSLSPVHLMTAIGLSVCVLADVILDLSFLTGTVFFGIGHLCYCAALLMSGPPGRTSLAVFMLLAAAVAVLYPQIKKLSKGKSALPYLAYALLISAMLSLAIGQKPLMMAGALLFVVSDIMLLFRIVRNISSKCYDYLAMGCYYLAQFLIASSTVF